MEAVAACLKFFMGLALVHFQKYWLLSVWLILMYALSFYRSQNVLCLLIQFLLPDQKFNCIFCATTKQAKKLEIIFWSCKKHFGTCGRVQNRGFAFAWRTYSHHSIKCPGSIKRPGLEFFKKSLLNIPYFRKKESLKS